VDDGGSVDEQYHQQQIRVVDERLALAGLRLALAIAMGSVGARLPNVPARPGHTDENARKLHHFALQRTAQAGLHAVLPQIGEKFERLFSQNLLRAPAGQLLHEGVQDDIAQLEVIDDNSLSCTFDDLLTELAGVVQRGMHAGFSTLVVETFAFAIRSPHS